MLVNLTYTSGLTRVGLDTDWRTILATGNDTLALAVRSADLYEGDALLAEWRDGAMWVYNGTLNGIDALPVIP